MSHKILLVVHDVEVRSQLRAQLKGLGYWVAESSPTDAPEVIDSQGPDLLLLSPDPSSRELLISLKGQAVLLVMGDCAEGLEDWFELGISDVLLPPYQPYLVKARCASALAFSRLRECEVETLQGLDTVARALASGPFDLTSREKLTRRGGAWAEIARLLPRPDQLDDLKREVREPQEAPAGSGRVLVVEDDAVSRKMLALHLQHRGYEVQVAEDGVQALERLAQCSFDAILLDQMMPRLDGYGVLSHIKSDPVLQDVPVIVISANEAAEDVIRLIEMGAQDHLVKPYNVRLLDARLRSSLMAKRMRDQELEYIRGVQVLTQAAAAVEAEDFRPEVLNELALRKDAIGRLGRVFQKMAGEMLTRQHTLKKQLSELKQELDSARDRAERGESTQTDYSQTLESSMLKGGGAHIHVLTSFRGGTGTSTVTANLGVLLASAGYRVALLDFALENPGLHSLFGLSGQEVGLSLHDILLDPHSGEPPIDLTERLGITQGRLQLIPASTRLHRMARVLRQGYEPHALTQALERLVSDHDLQFVLVDTQAGLNEELVLSLLLANSVSLILRADAPDLEGAGVLVQVAQKLKVEKYQLLLNQIAHETEVPALRGRVEETFTGCSVVGYLPRFHGSQRLPCLDQADSPWSQALRDAMVQWLKT